MSLVDKRVLGARINDIRKLHVAGFFIFFKSATTSNGRPCLQNSRAKGGESYSVLAGRGINNFNGRKAPLGNRGVFDFKGWMDVR